MLITLYHGTSNEAADGILESGQINGPVYLTANRECAEDVYVYEWEDEGALVTVEVDTDDLPDWGWRVDMEKLNTAPQIAEAIERGMDVYCKASIPVERLEVERITNPLTQ